MKEREIVGWRYIETMVDGRAGFTAVIVGERGPITEKLRNGALVGRCATCRWAESAEDPQGPYTLQCARTRAEFASGGALHPRGSLAIAPSYGGFPGCLAVAPDFGCVQWQAKDSPAPEPT